MNSINVNIAKEFLEASALATGSFFGKIVVVIKTNKTPVVAAIIGIVALVFCIVRYNSKKSESENSKKSTQNPIPDSDLKPKTKKEPKTADNTTNVESFLNSNKSTQNPIPDSDSRQKTKEEPKSADTTTKVESFLNSNKSIQNPIPDSDLGQKTKKEPKSANTTTKVESFLNSNKSSQNPIPYSDSGQKTKEESKTESTTTKVESLLNSKKSFQNPIPYSDLGQKTKEGSKSADTTTKVESLLNSKKSFQNPKTLSLDKDFFIQDVRYGAKFVKDLPESFKNDRAFMLELFRWCSLGNYETLLKYTGTELATDSEFLLDAIKLNPYPVPLLDKWNKISRNGELINAFRDKAFVLKAIEVDPKNARDYCNFYKECLELEVETDEELERNFNAFMLEVINTINVDSITNIDRYLGQNKDLIVAAAKRNYKILKVDTPTSRDIRANKNFMVNLMKINGLALELADKQLKNDESCVVEAVKQNGLALEFASERQQDNPICVLQAINQNPNAINFASSRLQYRKPRKEYLHLHLDGTTHASIGPKSPLPPIEKIRSNLVNEIRILRK